MRHVVWDWNGTLLDDLPLVVEAVNVLMAERDLDPITARDYTEAYTRPVRVFYERLFGRGIDDEEWQRLDDVFHHAYDAALADHARLADGAREALAAVDRSGCTQSLLSMYRHDPLVALLDRFGLHDHFEHVQGLTGPGGGRKLPHLEVHLDEMVHLHGDDPSSVLVVGDALDDADAANHLGCPAVLIASGSHPRAELEAAGVPVVDTLAEALRVGDVLR